MYSVPHQRNTSNTRQRRPTESLRWCLKSLEIHRPARRQRRKKARALLGRQQNPRECGNTITLTLNSLRKHRWERAWLPNNLQARSMIPILMEVTSRINRLGCWIGTTSFKLRTWKRGVTIREWRHPNILRKWFGLCNSLTNSYEISPSGLCNSLRIERLVNFISMRNCPCSHHLIFQPLKHIGTVEN